MGDKKDCFPIGVFDSGIGGISVVRAIRQQIPPYPVIYVADQANVPYGSRSLKDVREFSIEITNFLLKHQARLVVVACNTASAAALQNLRQQFPDIPFVGMEPAIKPAAQVTASGKVGVLATPATFQGKLYASVVERFAKGTKIYQSTCEGLVQQIEMGNLTGGKTYEILEAALKPMLMEGIDVVVLGCTHYPFVEPVIREICGAGVKVIDPSPAVARQVKRILKQINPECPDNQNGGIQFFTTGDPSQFERVLELLNESGQAQSLRWDFGRLW